MKKERGKCQGKEKEKNWKIYRKPLHLDLNLMERGPKYFSHLAIDCTTDEALELWRVGKFKPLLFTKRKRFFLPFSIKESQ